MPRTEGRDPNRTTERGRTRDRSRGHERVPPGESTQLPRVGASTASHHHVLETRRERDERGHEATRTPSSDHGTRKSLDLKKIKLEAKEQADTQPDSDMADLAAPVSNEPNPFLRIDHSSVFKPHEVYDLTSGDPVDDDDELNTSKPPETKQGSGSGSEGGADSRPFAALTHNSAATAPQPQWLQGLMDSLQGLHMKTDQTHKYCLDLGAVVGQHDVRIQQLETVAKDHTEQQDATLVRLSALEKAVGDLERRSRSITPSRAPDTPRGSRTGNVSPRSPRGGPPSDAFRDPAQDLGLVIGGWTDARVAEAETEVQNMFTQAGFAGAVLDFSGPSGRTNFLRVSLDYEGAGITELGKKRLYQTQVINKLKALKAKSGIVGQENSLLWIQRDRSVEERLRIRAIVLAKNFYNAIPLLNSTDTHWPDPEIVWRGQLFVGQTRTLKNMDDGHEPAAYDQIIEDVKGNHTVWFLSAESFAKITGRDKESLQQMWQDFGPAANPMGKGLDDLARTWDVLGFQGTHIIGLQEVEELLQFCDRRRYHDTICLCCDLNYDVLDIVNVDERGIPLGQLLGSLNLQHTRPSMSTWKNTTGSSSRIDFILFAMPSLEHGDDRVEEGSDDVIGSDHCAVSVDLRSTLAGGRSSFRPSKCGKWWTDGPKLQTKLAERLELQAQDLSMQDLEQICSTASKRVTSCRYVDSAAIYLWRSSITARGPS
ncbi:unnamed protein product [Symbiodinium sp. CCMP2592]|nr:unnamed protein product [Symbiodinium sp. CCMP2592]